MKFKTSNEIRNIYIKYFEDNGHKVIKSASLIPTDDSSLLWVNAGIVPFKKYFDGTVIPKNKKLTSCQKCIRTNDIELVGKTARHHTFFEMLGNFSIGDYFKEEAIKFAYELLVSNKYFGIDKKKLYITVYCDDQEAYELWKKKGIDSSHIIKLKENFWEIGEGPCGPDTEIFYDRGEEFDLDKKGLNLLKKGIENDRYIEIWNNVFTQFNAKEDLPRNEYSELPSKNIDTGMGLERMACIFQNVKTNYETDLFKPIIEEIEKISNQKYTGQIPYKVIADHIRAITFAINDGALFSNEGRGYVLRRLLRRAVLFGKKINIDKPFMHNLVKKVVEIMKNNYPELVNKQKFIEKVILNEEELFHLTLISGEKKLYELIKNNKNTKKISGKEAFKLYDTYGFPFELTLEYLKEYNIYVSKKEFDKYMNQQKERARKARKKNNSMNIQNEMLLKYKNKSRFIGYDKYECRTKVIGLIKDNKIVNQLIDKGLVVLEETPFYAELGGQAADIGEIKGDNCKLKVKDVIKAPHKQHLHIVDVIEGSIKLNDLVQVKININRRKKISQNHSAIHLLQEALREVLDNSLVQAGSKVDDKIARFDFTYSNNNISDEEIVLVEKLVNEKINTKTDAKTEIMSLVEAKEKGAIAFFDDKYEDLVRVVTLFDSVELCGGTHVSNVGEIKKIAIKSFETKGSNVYRIEVVTDTNIKSELFKEIKPYNEEIKKLLNKAKRIIKSAKKENIDLFFDVKIDNSQPLSYKDIIYNRNEVVNVRTKVKELEKKYINEKEKNILNDLSFLEDRKESDKIGEYIVIKIKDYDVKLLKKFVDELIEKLDNGFIFIANIKNSNVNFIAKMKKSANRDIDCGMLVKEASQEANGNGGGSKWFAQGGGTNVKLIKKRLLFSDVLTI